MTLTYVSGDPLLTRAQTLAFGHNARGRVEVGKLETCLHTTYPTAFAAYRKTCQAGRIKPGMIWAWRQTTPHLYFMVVRESSVGATRPRYVDGAALKIARDYALDGVTSLAIAPLSDHLEWRELLPVLAYWFDKVKLPVFVYESVIQGEQANEDLSAGG